MNRERVLETIFKFPTRGMSLRDISRESGISTPVVSRQVSRLKDEGLVETESVGKSRIVRGKLGDPVFKLLKSFYNIYSLFSVTKYIVNHSTVQCLVAFGSYSRGEDTDKSDLDIFLVGEPFKKLDLSIFEKELSRTIQLFISIKGVPAEMDYVRRTGVLLYGEFP